MLRRIKLQNYKSFKDLDVSLKPISVIFGPNASGKSNFLDAIYLASRAVTSRNLKEAFSGHRGYPLESFYYADTGFEKLLEKDKIEMSFEIDIEISQATIDAVNRIIVEKRRGIETATSKNMVTEKYLRYNLGIEVDPKSGFLRVTNERLAALTHKLEERKGRGAFLEPKKHNGSIRLHLRREGQASAPTQYEIGLDHTIVSSALYEPHYPHIAALRMELENWQVFYLEPRVLMREEEPLAEVTKVGPRGENLAAFLNSLRIKDAKAYDNFNLTLKSILPRTSKVELVPLKEGLLSLRLHEDGVALSARLISEGTLRVLGLLAIVNPKNAATLIGYEEPENGVHPRRLKIIADALKKATNYNKQIIVTTHSPLLPRYFDSKELFISAREGESSLIRPFATMRPIFRRGEIYEALEERILRGDFGG